MIQRIQSIYLLLVAGLMGVVAGVAPLARVFSVGEGAVVDVTAFGFMNSLGILAVIAAALPFVTIFLYKHRGLQLRLCVVEMVLLLGVLGMEVWLLVESRAAAGSEHFAFTAADVFPLVAIILMWLATRAVFKDMVLIKSLDRIR